jgi:hypothetical protein
MPPDYKHRVVGRVIGRASMKIGYFLCSDEQDAFSEAYAEHVLPRGG